MRHQGFSRTDLTVCIVIALMSLAALGGYLLLPSTRRGESYRLNSCRNNQRQITLALQMYHDSHRKFPGYVNDVSGMRASYVVPISPYIENQRVWEDWKEGRPSVMQMKILICPASSRSDWEKEGHLSYVLNGGYDDNECYQYDGVFHNARVEKPVITTRDYLSVYDGESHTIVLSENLNAASTWNSATDDSKKFYAFRWWDNATANQKLNSGDRSTTTIDADTARPSSYHPGGVVVAFVDGSTRFISASVDENIWKQLCTSNGSESKAQGHDTVNQELDETAY